MAITFNAAQRLQISKAINLMVGGSAYETPFDAEVIGLVGKAAAGAGFSVSDGKFAQQARDNPFSTLLKFLLFVSDTGSSSGGGGGGGGGGPLAPWVRPADWLPVPVLTSADEKVVGLLAVTNDGSNYNAFQAAGDYTIDWGDGTVANVASGVLAEHHHDFPSLPANTLTTRGYKQVLVTITPQAGQHLTMLKFTAKNTRAGLPNYSTHWLDLNISAAFCTDFTLSTAAINALDIEKCIITMLGVPILTTGFFNGCRRLESVSLLDTADWVDFSSMFMNCSSLQTVPLFNTAAGITFTSMFNGCASLQNVSLFNTAAGITFTSMFQNCSSLQTVPLFNTAAGVTFTSMFQNCVSLQTVPLFNLISATGVTFMFKLTLTLQNIPQFNTASVLDFTQMLNSSAGLQSIPALNMAAATTIGTMCASCPNLSSATMIGATRAISFDGCKLDRAALVVIFNNLGTANGAQTITITNNHGAVDLSAADRLIATGKGWTIVG